MRKIGLFLSAFGFSTAYFGTMVWALHEFGRNVKGQEGLDEFGSLMVFLGSSGFAIGLLAVLILKRTKPRC